MQALIKSKLILTLITTILLAGAITVPLSSSILHSHAASASSQASWSVVPSPNAGTSEDYLNSVTGISSSDIWTVGYSFDGTTYQTLIEHWDGASWSVVPSTNSAESSFSQLKGVTAVSSSDVWAVGAYANSNSNCYGDCQTLIEHYYAPSPTSQLIKPSPDPNTNSTSGPVPKKLNIKIRVKKELLAASALGHIGQAIAVASLHEVDPDSKN